MYILFRGGLLRCSGDRGGETINVPISTEVQVRPPRDQRLATQYNVSGREEWESAIQRMCTSLRGSTCMLLRGSTCTLFRGSRCTLTSSLH